jgi:hypothetical protein
VLYTNGKRHGLLFPLPPDVITKLITSSEFGLTVGDKVVGGGLVGTFKQKFGAFSSTL